MSQSSEGAQSSDAEPSSAETHFTWSQYTSLGESSQAQAGWSHQAQGNGEPPEEISSEYNSDSAQTTSDEHPAALEVLQEASGFSSGGQADDEEDQEEPERQVPRFATPTDGGGLIRGNGPIPLPGGHEDTDDS